MSKQQTRNDELPMAVADAQAATATLETEQTYPTANETATADKPIDPTDLNYFLGNIRVSDRNASGPDMLRFKDDKVHNHSKKWRVHWRHAHKVEEERDQLLARGVVLVERGKAIYNHQFDDLIEAQCFKQDGRIHSRFRHLDKETGVYRPEMVAYLQPIAAAEAMQAKTNERVAQKTDKNRKERAKEEVDAILEIARSAGARKGAVAIQDFSNGDIGYSSL